jgi:uncharacterized protein
MDSKVSKRNSYLLLILVVLATLGLLVTAYLTKDVVLFDTLSKPINKHIAYQAITLLGTFLFLLLLKVVKKEVFSSYFRKGDTAAFVIPVPQVGIIPKAHENWSHIGKSFSVVISIVTAIVLYLQVVKQGSFAFEKIMYVLPFSLLFALSNSFVEECITRLGVVIALDGLASAKTTQLVSALIFGLAHYFGNPGGPIGVLVAGFLGWLLAKSLLETKGLFWAWAIHFLQDIIILTALFSLS